MSLRNQDALEKLGETLKSHFIDPEQLMPFDIVVENTTVYETVFGYALLDRYLESLDWAKDKWGRQSIRWSSPEPMRIRFSNPCDRMMFLLRWG